MNYYQVEAKCGHVKRNNYIVKKFYVHALNKKEAAAFVRYLPRVKHHHKDAIINVVEIDYDEFIAGKDEHDNDMYFKVTNSSDQRLCCDFSLNEIHREEDGPKYNKPTHVRKRLVEILMVKDWKSGRNYVYE